MNDSIKNEIRARLEEILRYYGAKPPKARGKNWDCIPSRHKDGAGDLSIKENVCCCHCELKGDSFNVIAILEGLETTRDFKQILDKACQILRLDNTDYNQEGRESMKQEQPKQETKKPETKKDYSTLIEKWHNNASHTDYFKGRGLTEKTINKYKLGYNKEGHSKYGKSYKYLIPISDNFIIFRSEEGEGADRYRNTEGSVEVLNLEYIKAPDINNIFIVEGALDAFSIEEAGHYAISLNSTSNEKKLIEYLKANKKEADNKNYILIPDNDRSGKALKEKYLMEFKEIGLELYISEIPPEQGKDTNDYLRNDKEGFINFIESAVEKSKGYVSAYLSEFINNIMDESKRKKPISTGFFKLNNLLGGGLYAGLYAIGGISSLGKTSVILQVADYIAGNGTDVLFFSLEMSKLELVAKSISREIFYTTHGKTNISTRDILDGTFKDSLPEFKSALEKYTKTAQNMAIFEGCFDTGIDEVRQQIKRHISRTGKTPVVIIDYLQILKGSEKMTDKQNIDYSVAELKRISRDYETPVIVVSSFNRQNYSTPVSYESFKESGSIEYSSDVIIGLQLSIVKDLEHEKKGANVENRKKIDEAKKANPRNVDLVILKNRNGIPNAVQGFSFYARNNFFKEV